MDATTGENPESRGDRRTTDHRTPTNELLPPGGRFDDRENRPIDLRRYGDGPVGDEFEALVDMYLTFDRLTRTSDMPPATERRIRTWLEVVLVGYATVAWHGTRAVGHVVLVPDSDAGHELAVFVHQDYARAGIGGALVDAVVAAAEADGVGRVWLLTTGENRPMLKIALARGFSVTGRGSGQIEMTMASPADVGRES